MGGLKVFWVQVLGSKVQGSGPKEVKRLLMGTATRRGIASLHYMLCARFLCASPRWGFLPRALANAAFSSGSDRQFVGASGL